MSTERTGRILGLSQNLPTIHLLNSQPPNGPTLNGGAIVDQESILANINAQKGPILWAQSVVRSSALLGGLGSQITDHF